MSNIRVTYSGLIAFVIGITSVVTGFVFSLFVTRRLNPDELGLWTLIGSLVSYVVIADPIISYWTSRQIARGEQVGKTALITSGLFSIGATIVYIVIILFLSPSLKANIYVLLLGSILTPITFLNNILTAITLSHKPHAISYGFLSFELAKIPSGFFLVYILNLGISGAILATFIASVIKMTILFSMTRKILVGKLKLEAVRFWLRLSWMPMYYSFSGLIFSLDVLVYSLLTNSLVGLAYWSVASMISNLVAHSGQISQGLFPKLIATGKKELVEQNIKRLMFFAIPILAISIVLAKPALYVLNPIYVNGFYIVWFLSIRSVVHILRSFFYNILESYETVDMDKQASFRQYLKSKLFLTPTLSYILSGCYIVSLSIFLILSKPLHLSDVTSVLIWGVILLGISLPFMLYGMLLVKRIHGITLPYATILKFSSIALLASTIIYLISQRYLVFTKSVYDFIPQLIPLVGLFCLVYFGISYVSDKSIRELINSIFKEIKK